MIFNLFLQDSKRNFVSRAKIDIRILIRLLKGDNDNMLRVNNRLVFEFYIIFSACIFFIGLVLTEFLADLQPVMISFFVLYVLTLIYAVNAFGWFSLYCIYLYTSAFFMYNCIFLSLLSSAPSAFLAQDFPVRYSFSEDVGRVFIICCFLTVYFGHISFCLFSKKKKNKEKNIQNLQYIRKFEIFGAYIFLIALIPVCTKILIQLQFIMNYGYPAIYTKRFEQLQYPIWCTGAFLIFNTGYFIILAANPSKKKFVLYTVLFLLVTLLNALKGGRAGIVVALIISLYWYKQKYGMKINFIKLFFLLVVVFFFIAFITTLRESYDGRTGFTNQSFFGKIYDILWRGTTSRAVPMLIIRGDLKYHNFPFIFSPFTDRIFGLIYGYSAATIELIQTYNEPSIVLISNVSLATGLSGSGYGSAFIGEAYEIGGYVGIVLFTILFSYFLFFLERKSFTLKNLYIPLCYTLISSIPRASRKEIFQFIRFDLNKILVCYAALFVILFLLKKRRG